MFRGIASKALCKLNGTFVWQQRCNSSKEPVQLNSSPCALPECRPPPGFGPAIRPATAAPRREYGRRPPLTLSASAGCSRT